MHSLKTIDVLLVEDDEDDYFLLSSMLNQIKSYVFQIKWASSFKAGKQLIATETFDLCFFDYLLGAETGIELLKHTVELGVSCPVIMLTGKGYEKIDIESMQLGAMDYLTKGELYIEKLERCIRYALGRAESIKHLRKNDVFIREVFDKMTDAIILKRPNGKIFHSNTAFSNLFGYDKAKAHTLIFNDLFVDQAAYFQLKQLIGEQEVVEEFEAVLETNFGKKIVCELEMSKQLDSNEELYFLFVIKNITLRKKLERDRLLIEKSASTARFIRTLAHEVRNPLTNIQLALDQLEQEMEGEDNLLFTEIIRRNGNRINDLISELLTSFKPEAGNFSQVAINQLLSVIIELNQDRFRLKNIEIESHFSEDCMLMIDSKKIQLALSNIIVNAIEAMKEGKGILKIITNKQKDYYVVRISDNGVGMSPKQLENLFEPYFTTKQNGIGLGLASTFAILQLHKATIEVESEINFGTTFIISFPIQ